MAADLGVNAAAVGETINTLYGGVVVSKFNEAKDRYDVRVLMKDDQRKNLSSLNDIYLSGSNDHMVPLDQVTRKVFTTSSSTLERYDRSRQIEGFRQCYRDFHRCFFSFEFRKVQ